MRLFLSIFLANLLPGLLAAQSALTLNGASVTVNGASVHVAGDVSATAPSSVSNSGMLAISGSLRHTSAGTFALSGAGWVRLSGTGTSALQNAGGGTLWVNRLEIDKAAGLAQLEGGLLRIGTALLLANGSLDLNGQAVALDADAALQGEAPGRRVYGSGYIQGQGTVSAPAAQNLFGLGFVATSPDNWGATTLTRWHDPALSGPYASIERRYRVDAANNTGLTVSIHFQYLPEELAGQDPASLVVWKSPDNADWLALPSAPDPGNDRVGASGITGFSYFTVGDVNNPLPVSWLYFGASPHADGGALLEWGTATAPEASHFDIEHSSDGHRFEAVGRVEASPGLDPSYRFRHPEPRQGTHYYRLRQFDRDGTASLSPLSVVELGRASAGWRIYPNPVSPGQTLRAGQLPERWELWSAEGRLAGQGAWPEEGLAFPAVPSGYYVVKLLRNGAWTPHPLVVR